MGKTRCGHDGCAKQARRRGGVCIRHGAKQKVKRCSHEGGCANGAIRGGVCVTHGAAKKRFSHHEGGCINQAQQGGVCFAHGAKVKRCSQEGCDKQVVKGGVCYRHGAKSLLATAPPAEVEERPLQPRDAETVGAIATSAGSGKIGSCNPQEPNISLATTTTSRQPLSLHHPSSEIDPNLLNEEEIGAWIYECSDFARRNVTTTAGGAIAGGGSGKKIGACDPHQTNISHANGCQSPSILSSSATTSDFAR